MDVGRFCLWRGVREKETWQIQKKMQEPWDSKGSFEHSQGVGGFAVMLGWKAIPLDSFLGKREHCKTLNPFRSS